MFLLSENLPAPSPPGPAFPKVYPELDQGFSRSRKVHPRPALRICLRGCARRRRCRGSAKSHNGSGFWALTRYEDVMRVDGDPKTFSSQKGGILMAYGHAGNPAPAAVPRLGRCHDQHGCAGHLQLRREHMPYFTPAYLAVLKEKVAAETTRLIDAMADLGECDLVDKLSAQLPLFTLCEILGVPQSDRPNSLTGCTIWKSPSNITAANSATRRSRRQSS